jgi:LmbE family N-acetylglucosaminyl deacetylase
MLSLTLNGKGSSGYSILCLGAHCDDIEIGCGGTLMKWQQEYPDTSVHWIVFSRDKAREREARKSAGLFLSGARKKEVIVNDFRNGFFPYIGAEIKEYFEILKGNMNPDVIFTHYRHDLHQDHRLLSDLTWNTFRNHLILEYEIPKYDGDLSSPNVFVPLAEAICRKKIDIITGAFKTQKSKHWFTEDIFWSTLRLRGMESGNTGRYAEGFYSRKISL